MGRFAPFSAPALPPCKPSACMCACVLALGRRFLIGRTANTLLMGDLESCKLSEIPWQTDGSEKFHFENDRVCMVHYQVRRGALPGEVR